jgi:Ca2+-binding EF-hand superfamily protein
MEKQATLRSSVTTTSTNKIKLQIDEREKRYFYEIFNLNVMRNEDGSAMKVKQINEAGLNQIFSMIGFTPNKQQQAEFKSVLAQKGDTLRFDDFIRMLSLKDSSEFSDVDIKNAFRLLSREYRDDKQNMIKLDRVQSILLELGLPEDEVDHLMA